MNDVVLPYPKQRSPGPQDRETAALLLTGKAADGLIQVSFHQNGLIKSIRLDPRVKRLSVDELAEGLVSAVSTVQAELVRQATSALEAHRAAGQSLDEKIEVIYHEYLSQTAEFQHIGNEILKQIKE